MSLTPHEFLREAQLGVLDYKTLFIQTPGFDPDSECAFLTGQRAIVIAELQRLITLSGAEEALSINRLRLRPRPEQEVLRQFATPEIMRVAWASHLLIRDLAAFNVGGFSGTMQPGRGDSAAPGLASPQ